MPNPKPWWSDKSLLSAVVVGIMVRVLPLVIWADRVCVRDECTYSKISRRIVDGEGMVGSAGWLWAPGYPMIVAAHRWVTDLSGSTKVTQIVAAAVCTVLLYRIVQRAFGDWGERERTKTARIAAWMYALSPHMVFFSISLWSEVLYGTLLLALLLTLDRARDALPTASPGWLRRAALVGFMAGICVLFRGVATYMVPIFAVTLLWGRMRNVGAHKQVAVMVLGAAVTVAPYSMHISKKFDATIISDRTLGQMMWLGNNDFSPITFDYGNGYLSQRAFKRHTAPGRKQCAGRKQVIKRDTCNTENGKEWIANNLPEFVMRMPLRVAQMLNPNSLMTRHLRWGGWRGLPQWVDELLIALQAIGSGFVLIGGSFALVARGRGGHGLVTGLILLYHCAAIAALAGLTRYRVPLEPLLMVYGAGLLSDPRRMWAEFLSDKWRIALGVVVMAWVIPLVLWFLPAGWPWWRSW
ncbi:MAG: glycosyltransferase family 39 protein [Myxococcota bacterium]|nr:glycosyltransferase family 39 protein [Myxococcota bacterium]